MLEAIGSRIPASLVSEGTRELRRIDASRLQKREQLALWQADHQDFIEHERRALDYIRRVQFALLHPESHKERAENYTENQSVVLVQAAGALVLSIAQRHFPGRHQLHRLSPHDTDVNPHYALAPLEITLGVQCLASSGTWLNPGAGAQSLVPPSEMATRLVAGFPEVAEAELEK